MGAGAALPAVAQPSLPTLGDGSALTTGEERRLGDRIIRELYRDPDYIDDPVLVEYVQGLWQALLAAARARGELSPELDERFAWEVLLGRDRTVNAFALPGGYLGVHLGLIGVVATRDELAASKNPGAAQAMMVGGQAVAIQNQLNFSRDMEREADRIGYGLMEPSGFAPQGFVSMFDKLQQANRLNDNGSWPYLRSHPLTTQRMADMQSRLPPGGAVQPVAPSLEHAMVAARARVLSNPGVDALRLWIAEPQSTGFASQPAARRAAAWYTAALASSQLRDFAAARTAQAKLDEVVRGDAVAQRQSQRLAAEIELAAGLPEAALQRLPQEAGRPELVLRTQALLRVGRPAEVTGALQTWVVTHPHDAAAWQLLASAWQAQGQPLRAVRAEAESHAARYDYAAAVDRFKAGQDLARKSSSAADYIEASIIDTRLRAMELLLKEQAAER
ncbi:M48 family metalloprotease [Acidovorax sp. 28-64-14]|uniref:M48 family metalloprotease n=1 Tax=Acidovorax sp. 28-64-14 TaxID=1970310 RepID=UPI0025BE2B53|nr:M48 family metalloprotease [Acidovorax sp. 28-64-14]